MGPGAVTKVSCGRSLRPSVPYRERRLEAGLPDAEQQRAADRPTNAFPPQQGGKFSRLSSRESSGRVVVYGEAGHPMAGQ